jgi:phospholipase C
MSDLRDPLEAERLAFEAPDAYLRRREFLARTAMTAGIAAGAGLLVSPDTLVAAAGQRQRRRPLPDPRNLPIDTFVVLMMENRSFDHYLGWMPKADGRQAGLQFTDKTGQSHATQHLSMDFQGCAFNDPDHSWDGGRTEVNGGKMDGFLKAGQNDIYSISYYEEPDLPFIPAAAKAFTTFDRFHCSLLGPTFPNREYMRSGQSYGMKDNSIPFNTGGFPDTTLAAAVMAKGLTAANYFSDVPTDALWGQPGINRSHPMEEYYSRAAAGTLPNLTFVDPAALNEGGGTSADEHPHGDVRTGQAFMADVVHAFMEGPQFKRGALFITYDEWGGFFDHVAPPRVPDDRENKSLDEDFGQMGLRIPVVAVSPWAQRGVVEHSIYGFESIIKMISYRFGIKPLTRRVAYARNIARSFDFESPPRLALPNLPHPDHVMSAQCSNRPPSGLRSDPSITAADRPKQHDFEHLVSTGYLERLGFHYRPATPDRIFREPDKLVKAHAAAQ